ncbi:MAG: MacB-like periplasmic core domain containing protein [Firmicutes bacterium]|nr:MacB-like periplasmic core domain containing protein [Bacillota bacterium]
MFWESIVIAFEGLRANKLRSALTMLGIIIGVGAVVTLVSLGLGVQQKVQNSIASLGSNLVVIMPGASKSAGGVRSEAGSNITLSKQDAQAISKNINGVLNVVPSVSGTFQIIYGGQNWNTSVQGTTPEVLNIRDYKISEGTFFSSADDESRGRVAVLGHTVAVGLFGNSSPVGQTIRIGKAPFRVIGVLASKGQSTMGQDQDDMILVPLSTAQDRLIGQTYINSIMVQAESEQVLEKVQEDITTLLRTRHHLAAKADDDFTVRNLSAIMETMKETTGTLTLFLGGVAAISLLVGGIGIMNIMLVSVTERTREIGIRKALGATYKNILLQFLIEAIVVSVTGGLVGILIGVSGAYAISRMASLDTVVSTMAILGAFGISVLIGLFFGIYPARKAALLDPIDALRYE